MNLFTLLVQAFLERQARDHAARLREAGLRAAAKGRRIAVAGALFGLAAAFLFAALVVLAVEMGLQYDRGAGLSYGGLMVSATILGAFALLSALIGAWVGSTAGSAAARVQEPPPPPPRSSELIAVLEEIALQLLKQFAQTQRPDGAAPSSAKESETRS